jgi:hypothetical protein
MSENLPALRLGEDLLGKRIEELRIGMKVELGI